MSILTGFPWRHGDTPVTLDDLFRGAPHGLDERFGRSCSDQWSCDNFHDFG